MDRPQEIEVAEEHEIVERVAATGVAKTLFEAPPHLGGCGPCEGQGNDGAGLDVLGLDEELDPAHKDEGFPRAGPSQDNGVPSSPPSNRSLLLSQPLTPGHGRIVGAQSPETWSDP